MRYLNGYRAVAATLAVALSAAYADEPPPALKDVFEGDFRVGAAISRAQIMGEFPLAMDLVARQFNTLTPENDMKWEKIEPLEGEFDWEAADALVEFAEAHGMEVAGHVLVWHSQTPDWVFQDGQGGPATRDALLARMEKHIRAVVGRYRGRIRGWEVVNEALNEDGSLRRSPWLEIIGEDYIEKAFGFAHAADPGAKLYYNDYNLYKPEKAAGARRLVEGLRQQGIAVHGVGLQGHYGLDNPRDLGEFDDAIRRFAAMGLEVYITELDLSVLPFPAESEWGADIAGRVELMERYNPFTEGLPAAIEEQQALRYEQLFRILVGCRRRPQLEKRLADERAQRLPAAVRPELPSQGFISPDYPAETGAGRLKAGKGLRFREFLLRHDDYPLKNQKKQP